MAERILSQCKEGVTGIISKIMGDCQITARLQELGFVPGGWVRVIRKGNPSIVQVGESRFCLRIEQIEGIVIVPCEESEEPQALANHEPRRGRHRRRWGRGLPASTDPENKFA